MKTRIPRFTPRSRIGPWGCGLALALGLACAARAQTVSGNDAIRFPAALPFVNGRPDLISVPVQAGGHVGGVWATNNLGATNLVLKSSIFGHNVEHLKPDAYLGQALNPPVMTSGAAVAWSAMTNASLITPSGNAFFEPSVRTIYAAAGGEVVIRWKYDDGTEVDTTYIVEAAPAGRPYRVYWTDRGAPKVNLNGKFVRFHYNDQVTAPRWVVTTNENNVVVSNVLAGLYIDDSGGVNAVGGQQGMIVMQYFKTGMYNDQVNTGSVIVIEVMPPDNQTLDARLGERVLPQGGWAAVGELTPEITAGLTGENPYLYQHTSSDGSAVPKLDWLFPIRRSVDDPWSIEIYWKVADLVGTRWFYEVDDYAAEWPECRKFVRGDGPDYGAALYFPSNLTPSIMAYQEPEDGCATMSDPTTLITTTNEGRCLVQLLGDDDNVWFLPLELITREYPAFDLNPTEWMISSEIQPFATARSILFPEGEGAQAILAPSGLPLATNFTLECWVMPGNLEDQTNTQMAVFDKNTPGGQAWSNQVRLVIQSGSAASAGTLTASLGSGRTNSPWLATMTSTNRVESFRWSHLALTLQGRTLSLYVDGSLGCRTTLGTNGVLQTNSSPIYLGNLTGTNSAPFDGFIDNVRVWDIGLTSTQVQTAIAGNHRGYTMATLTNQGLKAYFPINALDSLAHLHDLTGRYNGTATNRCYLPDVGAIGMSDSAAYSETHGYIYEPFGTAYNTSLYHYASVSDPAAETAIYGVNTNSDLEVWWSEKIQEPGMPTPFYVPNWVQRYRNTWPASNESPHIVLASGQGSKQGGIYEQGSCVVFTNDGPAGSVILRHDTYVEGDFTVGAWIYLRSLPAAGQIAPILSFGNGPSDSVDRVHLAISATGTLYLGTANGTTHGLASAAVPSPTGRWIYVLASLDGSTATLYADNQLLATRPSLPVPAGVLRTNCYIGSDDLAERFHGKIDEVRLWSAVLDEDQRHDAMYHVVSGLDAEDLTLHFPFDAYKGNLILEEVTGRKALVYNAVLEEPGAPAEGSRIYSEAEQAALYYQNDAALPGFNPNEEHAILYREDGGDVVYAFRDDLNAAFHQSEPFVLVNYIDPETGRPAMDALRVVRTSEVYTAFADATEAGQALEGPAPLNRVPSHWTGSDICESGPAWEARDNTWFALAGGINPTATAAVIMHNYYPMQPGFWFPGVPTNRMPAEGEAIPWLPALTAQDYQRSSYPTSGMPIAVRWTISWPESIPVLDAGDTLIEARDDLPDIWNQLSVDVVYQQSATNGGGRSVFLFDPVCARGTTLTNSLESFGFETGGEEPSIYMRNGYYYFYGLPPDLSERFYFNPNLSRSNLVLIGEYVTPLTGSGYLLVNELDAGEREILTDLVDTGNAHHADWVRAIGLLAPDAVELAANEPFAGIALHAPGDGAGYVSLAFNNASNPAMGVAQGTPISLSLIRVSTNLATGRIIPIEDGYNLLSEQMSMLFSLDFAGEPGNYMFEWRWTEPNADGTTPTDPLACEIYTNGVGLNSLILNGQAPEDLINRFFAVRYRAQSNTVMHVVGTNWSEFTEFSLAEGWVQRILNALTPFEQRMRDLYNNPVETQVSMISQAGPPYEGDVALNQENLENVGLIQLYQTVLNRAERVLDMAGLHDAAANQQLLLAASRLNDLYMLLGNEAYADAMDPTIGFGSTMTLNNTAVLPVDYGSLASSLFCFDNQTASLIEEELALLRGRANPSLSPGMDVSPVFNRLFWNFTKGITAGEVAYAVNYDITGHTNAIIDAVTAKQRFPQGHGDAWGYYLDALTVYYKLLRHPTFDWGVPSITPMLMNDVTIDADYFDEKKFAEAAAALARAGVDILQRTYRQSYDESQDGLFPGYADSNTNRAWGVGQWGTRIGVGALCNWAVGNSLLPASADWQTNVASLVLAGAGYAQMPTNAYFNGNFTVEFWIKTANTGGSAEMDLARFSNLAGDNVEIKLMSGVEPALLVAVTNMWSTAYSGATIETGVWTHVAGVLEGHVGRIYVNGLLVKEQSGMESPTAIQRPSCTMGLGDGSELENYHGQFCELRVWSKARTAGEITGAMRQRLTGAEPGLVAYWPVNEGEGTLLLDHAPGGRHAHAVEATSWTNDVIILAAMNEYDDPGILRIDRSTVSALGELAANLRSAQAAVDNADRGLNPLGLARTSIPFDIDPLDIDAGGSHFEQILARAKTALNNARTVFDGVQDATRLLRQQQQSANNFQAAAISQEADYTRRIIEIYGYPYSDDIGTGKTYPQGYDGPDLYHYMYVDMSALGWSSEEIEPIAARTYEFTGDGADSILNVYGFATNEPPGEEEEGVTNMITFHYADNGLPCKPTEWTGTRRAEGRLQIAYAEFLKQWLAYLQALETYEAKTEYLVEVFEWYVQTFAPYKDADYANSVAVKTLKEAHSTLSSIAKIKKLVHKWKEEVHKGNVQVSVSAQIANQIMGVASGGDIFSLLRSVIVGTGKAIEAAMGVKQYILDMIVIADKWLVETTEYGAELSKLTHEWKLEAIDQETELGELVRAQSQQLAATKVAFQGMVQAYQNAAAIEQEGQRLLASRQRDRSETANRIASMRYSDMAFRIFRNDALSRYSSAFDLAAMYTYLAAKAYDYETGLLPAESSTDPGSRFLGDVVRARTLGRVVNGEPQVGGPVGEPGLADILARMGANWTVLDGRLGFNNPSWRQTWFSLRTELLRILPGTSGDAEWRTALNSYKVDDLFSVPEFRRYCIPFAAEGGLRAKEPALVIPFSTTIDFGHNFFGRVLAGGDHAFSSTEFATKIRSVGLWFSNYAANVSYPVGLANTPEAYLIPVGVDVMRSPSDLTGNTLRSWQVLDQAIPVPYTIGSAEINDADWIPLYDSLPDPLAAIRRYSALGAFDDAGVWSDSRVNHNSRLIGRSVWNSQWYLIIPAGSLNGDRALALEMFINGKSGDGNGVKDIKLLFETYSYSGN